jgi:hypothetical protein
MGERRSFSAESMAEVCHQYGIGIPFVQVALSPLKTGSTWSSILTRCST